MTIIMKVSNKAEREAAFQPIVTAIKQRCNSCK